MSFLQTTLALHLLSPVPTSDAYLLGGAVMGTMTVLITVMRETAPRKYLEHVVPICLPAPTIVAFLTLGAVTLIMIVGMAPMK